MRRDDLFREACRTLDAEWLADLILMLPVPESPEFGEKARAVVNQILAEREAPPAKTA